MLDEALDFIGQLIGDFLFGKPFAWYGLRRLALSTWVDGMDGTFGADYAEHPLIEGKPALQRVGDKLDEWALSVVLHQQYCNPDNELAAMRAMLSAGRAEPLTLANGRTLGLFVLTEIRISAQHTTPAGTLISAQLQLSLREYVDPAPLQTAEREAKAKAPAVKGKGKSSPRAKSKPKSRGKPPKTRN